MLRKLILLSLIFLCWILYWMSTSPSNSTQTTAADTWSQVVPEGDFWPERWDFQLASHQGQLLVVGGQNFTGYLNDIWSSSEGQQWQQLPKPGWSARAYFQLTEFNNALFLIGGETAQGMSNEVWVSRDRGQSWQEVKTGAEHFGARRLHQVLVYKNQLVLLGGEDDNHKQYSDIWLSDDGANWRKVDVDGNQWGQRKYFRAIAHLDTVLVLGGLDPEHRNQVFATKDLLNWSAFTPKGDFWDERMFFSSTVIDDNEVWFIGGGSTPLGSEANDILVATHDGPWRLEQPNNHFDRRGHQEAVLHEGKFYLMGGKKEDAVEKVAHHDIWMLDLAR